MDFWLLNAVYSSQFGCCNPQIFLFSQDKSRYQLCHLSSLNVVQSMYIAYHNIDRLYWFRDESNSIGEEWHNWHLDFSWKNCGISGLQHPNWLNIIQKKRLHLWHWCFMSQLLFISSNKGTFSLHNFFSDTLYCTKIMY